SIHSFPHFISRLTSRLTAMEALIPHLIFLRASITGGSTDSTIRAWSDKTRKWFKDADLSEEASDSRACLRDGIHLKKTTRRLLRAGSLLAEYLKQHTSHSQWTGEDTGRISHIRDTIGDGIAWGTDALNLKQFASLSRRA
ncbi:hypothetical protein PENTCL1PPCAC_2163, partial [Pristionchus entomophagus]